MSEPMAGDGVEIRGGKLYSEGVEISVEEAHALGWGGPDRLIQEVNNQADLVKVNLAARLRATSAILSHVNPDEATIKLVFDLKDAAAHLDDLDLLLELVLDGELEKYIISNPRVEEIKKVAAEVRERKTKGSDPEPKIV